jgi:hypothetical protein
VSHPPGVSEVAVCGAIELFDQVTEPPVGTFTLPGWKQKKMAPPAHPVDVIDTLGPTAAAGTGTVRNVPTTLSETRIVR